MLNPNAQKWVEALRSGKYEQGKNALCRDDKYCCLGVACEVALQNGVVITKSTRNITAHNQTFVETLFNSSWAYLPPEVQNWLGLKNDRASFNLTGLATMNDAGYSFEEIADKIEEKASELFV